MSKNERPRRRDPLATQRMLLEAAISEFTEKGLAGARVDSIAQRASVNKQMVYHYFGSKDELFIAALEEVYTRIRAREKELNLSACEPEEAMRRLVEFSFDYLAENPEFIALINDENRMQSVHLLQSKDLVSMHSPLVELIEQTLERGVRSGAFNDRFGPVNLYISIAALGYFYFSNSSTLSTIFDRDMTSPGQVARRREHVVTLILSALKCR